MPLQMLPDALHLDLPPPPLGPLEGPGLVLQGRPPVGPGRLPLRAVSKDVPEGIVVIVLANIIIIIIIIVIVIVVGINDDSQNGGITGVEVRGIAPASAPASAVRRGGRSSRPACSLRLVLGPVLGLGLGLVLGLVRYHHPHPLLGEPSRFLPVLPFFSPAALQELVLALAAAAVVAAVIAGDQAQIEQEADRGAVQQAPLEQAEDVDREGAGGRIVQAAHLRQQHEEEELPLGVRGRRGGGIVVGGGHESRRPGRGDAPGAPAPAPAAAAAIFLLVGRAAGAKAEVKAAAAGRNVLIGAAVGRVGHQGHAMGTTYL